MPDPSALAGRLVAGSASDVGRRRDRNEDAVLVSGPVFAVADGMGGHADGDVASRMVVEELGALAERAGAGSITADDVLSALRVANDRMVEASGHGSGRRPMGTTACGLAVVDVDGESRWAVFNIGDSRVYRYADGDLQQVSVDHSEVAELVQAGVLDPAHVQDYPRRNVVTRSLGHAPMLEVDLWVAPVTPGERYLLCSDGLTVEVPDDRLREVLGAAESPQDTAERLVAAAVEAGGRDNVTVAVVDVPLD
jgi:PPM family protein phosphatase